MNWQPIETAPFDVDKAYLVWLPDADSAVFVLPLNILYSEDRKTRIGWDGEPTFSLIDLRGEANGISPSEQPSHWAQVEGPVQADTDSTNADSETLHPLMKVRLEAFAEGAWKDAVDPVHSAGLRSMFGGGDAETYESVQNRMGKFAANAWQDGANAHKRFFHAVREKLNP